MTAFPSRLLMRLVDLGVSGITLLLLAPLMPIVACGIWLSSPGPVLYRSTRIGKDGVPFTMFKLRTMHIDQSRYRSRITGADDPRIFRFGALLRRLKLDETPQFFNILRGDMSLVGPRPEDPGILRTYYAPEHYETLRVLPGLASPGTIYYYTHCEQSLGSENSEKQYARELLPIKLALDTVYVRNASLLYNLRIIVRTAWVILLTGFGRRRFPAPPELEEAGRLVFPTLLDQPTIQ